MISGLSISCMLSLCHYAGTVIQVVLTGMVSIKLVRLFSLCPQVGRFFFLYNAVN